jgi:hypothetical protein
MSMIPLPDKLSSEKLPTAGSLAAEEYSMTESRLQTRLQGGDQSALFSLGQLYFGQVGVVTSMFATDE